MSHFPRPQKSRDPLPYNDDVQFIASLDARQRCYFFERARVHQAALQRAVQDVTTALSIVNALHESAVRTIDSINNPARAR